MSTPQRGQQRRGGQQADTTDYAIFGIVVFGAFAVARFLNKFIEVVFTSEDSLYYSTSNEVLFEAARSAFWIGDTLLLALGIATFYYVRSSTRKPSYIPAGIASAVGSAVVTFVFFVLMLLFAPDGASLEFGNEITGMIAAVIGVGATGAIFAAALEKSSQLT